jgi:hypothetical protein
MMLLLSAFKLYFYSIDIMTNKPNHPRPQQPQPRPQPTFPNRDKGANQDRGTSSGGPRTPFDKK